jgi:hypothetical protein
MHFLEETKKWVGQITEAALLLIALGVVVEILCGEAVPFFGSIAANLTRLLTTLGENGPAGLIAAGIILFLFHKFYGKTELPVPNGGKRQTAPARKGTRGRRK